MSSSHDVEDFPYNSIFADEREIYLFDMIYPEELARRVCAYHGCEEFYRTNKGAFQA